MVSFTKSYNNFLAEANIFFLFNPSDNDNAVSKRAIKRWSENIQHRLNAISHNIAMCLKWTSVISRISAVLVVESVPNLHAWFSNKIYNFNSIRIPLSEILRKIFNIGYYNQRKCNVWLWKVFKMSRQLCAATIKMCKSDFWPQFRMFFRIKPTFPVDTLVHERPRLLPC